MLLNILKFGPDLTTGPELTDEQFKLVGKIVVKWSNIEFLMNQLLSQLIFSPGNISCIFTAQMSARNVQEAIDEALILHRRKYGYSVFREDILDEIKKVNKDITRARSNRNDVAHACWSGLTGGILGIKYSSVLSRRKRNLMLITDEQLNSLYEESCELIDIIIQVTKKLPGTNELELAQNAKAKAEQIRLEGEIE